MWCLLKLQTHSYSTCTLHRHAHTEPLAWHRTYSPVQSAHTHTSLVCEHLLQTAAPRSFFMCIPGLVVTVLETFLLSKHNRVLTLPTISMRLCVCVADGTHVWSVVAGWLEPEVGGGLHLGQSGERGGSQDSNMNTHTPHFRLINHQRFTTVLLPVSLGVGVRVGWGRVGGGRVITQAFMSVNFIFRLWIEECVNGATTASFASSHQSLIQRSELGGEKKGSVVEWRWAELQSKPCRIHVTIPNGKSEHWPVFDLWHMVCTICGL